MTTAWKLRHGWYLIPSLLGGIVWWYSLAQALHGRIGLDRAEFWLVVLLLILAVFGLGLWLGTLMIGGYLTKSRLLIALETCLLSLPVLIWLPLGVWTLIAWILVWLALWIGITRAGHDARGYVTIRYRLLLSRVAPLTLLLILVAVSLGYYQILTASNQPPSEVVNQVADHSITMTERFLPRLYPAYHPDQTVDEFLGGQIPTADQIMSTAELRTVTGRAQREQAIREALRRQGIEVSTIQLEGDESIEELRQAIDRQLADSRDEAVAGFRAEFSKQFGVELRGDERLHDALTRIFNRQFVQRVEPYLGIVPPILAAALFFALRIFAGLFLLAIEWVGGGWMALLRRLRVVTVQTAARPVERLDWA